ncbi:MAG: hypothetical protein AB8B93_10505 [Pseudomonadales bacterium]
MRNLLAIAFIAFPMALLLWLEHLPANAFVGLFGLLAGARLCLAERLGIRLRTLGCLGIAAFCALAWYQEELGLLKIYPVLMSLGGASYGIYTLINPPSAIERLARATGMTVDATGARYTRGVTWMWVAFFVLNAAVAGYTALATSTSTWALYNGLVSYLIIAVLFAGEYVFRGYYRRQHGQQS